MRSAPRCGTSPTTGHSPGLKPGLAGPAYLRFAEAVNRLDLSSTEEGLPDLVSGAKESGAKRVTKGALEGVGEKLRDFAESGSQRPAGRTRSRGSGQRPRLPPASSGWTETAQPGTALARPRPGIPVVSDAGPDLT
jgi:hypothetical protein